MDNIKISLVLALDRRSCCKSDEIARNISALDGAKPNANTKSNPKTNPNHNPTLKL